MISAECSTKFKKRFKFSVIYKNIRKHLTETLNSVTTKQYDDASIDIPRNTADKMIKLINYRLEFEYDEEKYQQQAYTRFQEWRLYVTLEAYKTTVEEWDTFLSLVGIDQSYDNCLDIYDYYIQDFSLIEEYDASRINKITCNVLITPTL